MHGSGAATPAEVLCLGESMTLLTPTEGDRLEGAEACSLSFAGAESTVALYLAEQGRRVGWVSRVGEDPFGRRMVSDLRACGVDVSLVEADTGRPTGIYFKDPRPEGTRVHYYRRGSAAAAMGPELAERLPLQHVRLVHLSGITAALSDSCRGLLERLLERAHAAGVLVSFDVNYRPGLWTVREAAGPLREFARHADVTFVGRDEAEVLWGTGSAASVARDLQAPGLLVVKDGGLGATQFDGGAAAVPAGTFVPARSVDVVEPVGAGDAFAAGYLAGLLDGADAAARLSEGHRLAARALSSYEDFVPERKA